MTVPDIQEFRSGIIDLIRSHSNRKAIGAMRAFVAKDPDLQRFARQIDDAEQKYYYMLRFLNSSSPFDDVEGEMATFEEQLRSLLSDIVTAWSVANDPAEYYAQLRYQQRRPEETTESLFADYIEESKRLLSDTRAMIDTRRRATLERIAADIFMRIWTAPDFSDDLAATVTAMITDPDIPAYDRELWLNAVGLSASEDPQRIAILANIYRNADTRLAAAALMWLITGCMQFHNGFHSIDRSLYDTVRAIAESNPDDVLAVIEDFLRTVVRRSDPENERVVRDLGRMSAGMADRLSHIDPTNPSSVEDAMGNMPEGYFDKVKQFNDAQMRGDDVFAGTIGRMRHFPFFRSMPAWFLPFHLDRSELAPVVDSEGFGMASILEKMHMLTDSDKYALVLSLAEVPDSMRADMLANSYSSITGMAATDEGAEMMAALDTKISRRAAISNAVRGLARFAHHYNAAAQLFPPISDTSVEVTVNHIFDGYNPDGFEQFADRVAALGYSSTALSLYLRLVSSPEAESEDKTDPVLLVKAARVAEASDSLGIADSLYHRAIRNGDNSLETALSLAALLLKDPYGNFNLEDGGDPLDSPITILEPYLSDNPENPQLLRLLAEAYSSASDYHRAAEMYFNLNYILPQTDTSARGPLANALMHSGDYEEAIQVLADIPAIEKDVNLSATLAVAQWAAGMRDAAVITLTDAVAAAEGDVDKVKKALGDISFLSDIKGLGLLPEILDYKAYGSRFGNLEA